MSSCVIKVCRNYKRRLKTTHKVTYHRIPNDPIMKSRWVDIIRRSRGEDLWHPAKTTVICSDHFHKKDMYFVRNQSRRRLKKEVIPSKALFLSSLRSDESENSDENSDEDKGLPSEKSLASVDDSSLAIFSKDVQPSTSAKNDDDNTLASVDDSSSAIFSKDVQPSTSAKNEDDNTLASVDDSSSAISSKDVQPSTSAKNDDDNTLASVQDSSAPIISRNLQPSTSIKNDNDNVGDFSDLDYIFDTPTEAKLRKELHKKIRIQKKHTLKIQSLRRKNLRLKKKIDSFRQIIETLKKERSRSNPNHTQV